MILRSFNTQFLQIKLSKYATYTDLAKRNTEYARRMNHLSNRIFGEVTRPTNSKSMKVVRMFSEEPRHLKKDLLSYYPRHVETGMLMMKLREYGLYRDEHQDFKEEMARMRALRGKVKGRARKNANKSTE